MSGFARKSLEKVEKTSRDEILREFQQLQARLKLRFQRLLTEIEAQRTATGTVPVSFLFERSRLATLLADLSNEIKAMSGMLVTTVTAAQSEAVKIAETDFERYIQTRSNAASIVRFNPQAVRELIGNASNKTPLQNLMNNLPEGISQAVKNALIDGVAIGSSSREISRHLNTALGTGAAHALTIARTETNQAFRQASVSHYKENKGLVKGYIWLSVLDLRTCLICWSRHGVIYPLNKKPSSHVNCRCTTLPYLVDADPIETGEEQFKKLTKEQRAAILGAKRAVLYDDGLQLSDFVGEKQTDYGKTPFIKNLSDLPDPKNRKRKADLLVKPAPQPKPSPEPVKKAGLLSSEKAAAKLGNITEKFGAEKTRLEKIFTQAQADSFKIYDEPAMRKLMIAQGLNPDIAAENIAFKAKYRAAHNAALDAAKQQLAELQTAYRNDAFEVVKVSNPTNLKAEYKSRFSSEEKNNIEKALSEFNSLVSDKYLKGETFTYQKTRGGRAFYGLKKDVHIKSDEKLTTIIHETAHGLEHINKDVLDAAVEFWEYRTKGEKLQTLKKLTGLNYRSNEKAKKDKFVNPYDGKEPYSSFRMNNGKYESYIYATEIITRGMEYYWQNAAVFASEQPEYFDFIYKILRGEKWQPK